MFKVFGPWFTHLKSFAFGKSESATPSVSLSALPDVPGFLATVKVADIYSMAFELGI